MSGITKFLIAAVLLWMITLVATIHKEYNSDVFSLEAICKDFHDEVEGVYNGPEEKKELEELCKDKK